MERKIRSSFKFYKSIEHLSGNVEGDKWISELGVHWGGLTWRFMSFSIRYYLAMKLDWNNWGICRDRTIIQRLRLDSL